MQSSLTQYGLIESGIRLSESHRISTNLNQAIARMHQTLTYLLKLSFHHLGCCSNKSSASGKIFNTSSIPTIPARMKNLNHHRRLQEDRNRCQRTSPPTPKEINTDDSKKTDTNARGHRQQHRGDRRRHNREERRQQKNNHHYPRNAESNMYQTLLPPPSPSKQSKFNHFFLSKHK